MSGRIITARHGQPDLARDVKISARAYGEWWARYDEAGLAPGEAPPPSLIDIASGAATVFSSTLPRAIETARMATKGARAVPADVLYVEAPLPPPPVPILQLKPGAWGVVSRTFWFLGYAPDGVENHLACWRRVAVIADRLAEYSLEGDVLLCAHGYLNWMIKRRLTAIGWTLDEHEGGNHYWSWRSYKPGEAALQRLEARRAEHAGLSAAAE